MRDEEEDDDDEFEDEEEEYINETEEMQYEGHNLEDGANGAYDGVAIGDEEDEEDEEEYENEYAEDQDEEAEIETLESEYGAIQISKYDYGTDNEEEKEGEIPASSND